MSMIKLNKNLVRCHLFLKKLGLQLQHIFSTFKFNFIFTILILRAEKLLITSSIRTTFISNWYYYMIIT